MINSDEFFDIDHLLKISKKIDGNGYGAAKNLLGIYVYDNDVVLGIDRVPRDPDEPLPGKLRLFIPFNILKYDAGTIRKNYLSILAAKHFFTEFCYRTLRYEGRPWLWMEPPGQAILERTSVEILDDGVEIRLDFIPPYKGRKRISGGRLRRLFSETIPRIMNELKATSKKREFLQKMIHTIEDQEYLRKILREEGFIAFIANGSILPRRGDSDFPLPNAVPFRAPDRYTTEFKLLHHGVISGLAIRMGEIVVFAGANFHGKTTIMEALSVAHYNHIPGDGREFVISIDELPLVMVENRRVVRGVDISSFMTELPGDTDVKNFTTNNASGSTSQAAALIEAIECGVGGVLIDEDSSAVNFLLRDYLLRRIIPSDLEPITPLIDMLPAIKKMGITTIFAIGALGEFLRVADTVFLVSKFRVSDILMHEKAALLRDLEGYLPSEVAESLKEKMGNRSILKTSREREQTRKQLRIKRRVPEAGTIPRGRVKSVSYDEIIITWRGKRIPINLRGSIRRTLKEKAQVRALSYAITYASRYADGENSLVDIVNKVFQDIKSEGLEIINPYREEIQLNLAMFTKYQLFYALSRLPALKIKN